MPSRAGSRVKRFKVGYGRLSTNKLRLLRTQVTNLLVISALDPAERDEEMGVEVSSEEGLNFILLIPVPGRQKPLVWNMCSMTIEELEATRQFFTKLFDLAEPVVRHRDKVAQDAFEQGNDTFERNYRQLPQVVDRERTILSDGEGVLYRLASTADRREHARDSRREVRGDRTEVVDTLPGNRGSQDDREEVD